MLCPWVRTTGLDIGFFLWIAGFKLCLFFIVWPGFFGGAPASYVSSYDSEKLAADLQTANKKIDHLSDILNESESTNLRLSEQVRVLKDEVRRLENNREREQHAENLEYLKNVFIKFASLQPGSEKAMLIPVLTTMLKLNQSEQQKLKSVAGDIDTGESTSAGWSSYLHRWSGVS